MSFFSNVNAVPVEAKLSKLGFKIISKYKNYPCFYNTIDACEFNGTFYNSEVWHRFRTAEIFILPVFDLEDVNAESNISYRIYIKDDNFCLYINHFDSINSDLAYRYISMFSGWDTIDNITKEDPTKYCTEQKFDLILTNTATIPEFDKKEISKNLDDLIHDILKIDFSDLKRYSKL